jgi:hypothetical protein
MLRETGRRAVWVATGPPRRRHSAGLTGPFDRDARCRICGAYGARGATTNVAYGRSPRTFTAPI